MPDVFEGILGQPRVRRFLRATVAAGRIGQSYLFCGPAGSNKTAAAYALAQAAVCETGGCGSCDDCRRAARRTHPDIRYLAPQGASGYLVAQVRELIDELSRAPIRAKRKVCILDRADLLGVQAANAFLKTLEEPPDDVVIILLARTRESVLPTILSRCQVVPFRHIPAKEACGIVCQNTGADAQRAAIAVQACGGSITKAIEFLRSTERMEFRGRVVQVMEELRLADDLDVLGFAAELIEQAKAPLDLVRATQEAELAESADFMAKSAIRQIEQRNKRALTAKSNETLRQLTSIVRSWLRDALTCALGAGTLVVNEDVRESIELAARAAAPEGLVRALSACDEADRAIAANVSPETCIDVLLFAIRENVYA